MKKLLKNILPWVVSLAVLWLMVLFVPDCAEVLIVALLIVGIVYWIWSSNPIK